MCGHLIDITDVRREAVNAELETAWALLRTFSADTNRKVRDIAEVLVAAARDDRTPTKHGRRASAHHMLDHLYDAPLQEASRPAD